MKTQVRYSAGLILLLTAFAQAGPPPAPTVTWPAAGMVLNTNRPDITWTGGTHDQYEVHIGLYNISSSAEGWNSGTVTDSGFTATSGPLTTQQTYYVYVRNHNSEGWGPWSQPNVHFYVAGELLNTAPYLVNAPGGSHWMHSLCYNPDRNEYLVCYFDNSKGEPSVVSYQRLDGTGTKIGSETWIIDDAEGVRDTWVCYNSTRKEYLISYGGYEVADNQLWIQRVNAVNGAMIGSATILRRAPELYVTRVAYSPISDCYLIVWHDKGLSNSGEQTYAMRLDSTAVPLGGLFAVSNGTYFNASNPALAYNSVNNEFFVTFQAYFDGQSHWNYYGQRVRATDGALLGPNITISAPPENNDNGDVAFDGDLNRYLVVYQGIDPAPWGQLVSASGTLIGSRFSVPVDQDMRGGMPGITWNPITKEYLASWAHCCTAGNFVRRLSQTGGYIGEPVRINGDVAGNGNWDPLPVVNTANNEFLICFFNQYLNVYVRRFKSYPLTVDTTAPASITGLTLQRFPSSIALNWTNPSTADFMGTKILYKTSGFPTGPTDGVEIADLPNAPSTLDSFTHTGLVQGTTYYYAVFAHDEVPNYAMAAQASAKVFAEDFDGDGDVDMLDFAHLQNCLSGSGVPYGSGCINADIDEDGDVDQSDFTIFLACLAGANNPPGC